MPEVPEYVVNVKLAEILSRELGIDARAERIKSRKRPDIRCYYRGLIIGIEASYSRSDAEKDAERRIEQDLVDIALALWIKKSYKDVPEQQLYEAIRSSRFDVKIFVPRELAETLIPFIEKRIERKAEPVTGWFTDIDLPTLKTIIGNSIEFLIREEEIINKAVEKALQKINGKTSKLREINIKLSKIKIKPIPIVVPEFKVPEKVKLRIAKFENELKTINVDFMNTSLD